MTTIPASNIRMDQPADTAGADIAPNQSGTPPAATAGADAAKAADNSALLKELAAYTKPQNSDTQSSGARSSGPDLPPPAQSFSPDEMVALLRTLQEKTQSAQIESAKRDIDRAQIEAKQNNDQQLEKIDKWVEEFRKSQKSGLFGKIFGWIGKIAAFVASLAAVVALGAATIASGGAGSPLLALAVVGLIGSTMSLANQISQEAGGPEISIGNLIGTTMGKLLQAFGVPEETANKISRTMAGAAGLMMPALLLIEPSLMGDAICGVCGLAGVDEKTLATINTVATLVTGLAIAIAMTVATGGASAASTMGHIGRSVQIAGQVTSGVAQVGQGAASIETAKHQRSAEQALADKQTLAAMMILLQQTMEEQREEIEKIIKEIEESTSLVTRMINDTTDSMAQITSNLREQGAV